MIENQPEQFSSSRKIERDEEEVLFRQLSDGTVSTEDFSRLESRLAADRAFRERYLEFIRHESALTEILSQIPGEPSRTPVPPTPVRRRWGSVTGTAVAIAACLIVLAFTISSLLPFRQIQRDPGDPGVAVQLKAPESPVGPLKNAALAAALSTIRLPDVAVVTFIDPEQKTQAVPHVTEGTRLKLGMLDVQSGRMQLEFFSGAKILIEGPAQIFLTSPMEATLIAGRVAVRAPQSAKGFILHGPNAAVVDIGTEFTMSVDDDQTSEVHVVQGEVEVSLLGEDGNTLQSQRLLEQETVRLSRQMQRMDEVTVPTTLMPLIQRLHPRPLQIPSAYIERVKKDSPSVYLRFETPELHLDPTMIPNEMTGQSVARLVSTSPDQPGITIGHGQLLLSESPDARYLEFQDLFERFNYWSYTVEMWINPLELHHGCLFSVFPENDETALRHLAVLEIAHRSHLVHTPGAFRFLHRMPPNIKGGVNLFSAESCVPGQWNHLVATKSRTRLRLYVNGQLVREIDVSRVSDSNAYRILLGQLRPTSTERQFIGAIDEFAIYPRALTAPAILKHYQLMKTEMDRQMDRQTATLTDVRTSEEKTSADVSGKRDGK